LARLAAGEHAAVARLVEWLRIPSISTDPAYKAEVARGGAWAAARLAGLGFEVRTVETGTPAGSGHPIILAFSPAAVKARSGAKTHPHILFYGHYDVQPCDPLNLWESPPFEPVVREAREGEAGGTRVVARGAVDDKGQVATFFEAMDAWKAETGDPTGGVPYTVLLEGEEESGSVNLGAFLEAHRAELGRCEACLISDTGMLGRGRPAITYGVRGLAYTEIILHGPNQDLHSGLWGGRVPNPINELSQILGRLWTWERAVAIPGFYDDVQELSYEERAAWRELEFDVGEALAKIGLTTDADIGEAWFSAWEREWARPTAEINGIVGGYTGVGAKTVIPSHARAKVSFRLVPNQNPERVVRLFFDWLQSKTPPGCRWELHDLHGGHPATCSTDSRTLMAASRALKSAAGRKADLIKSGGSIPVAGMLKSMIGIDTIFMGFGLDDDRVHSPNEKFELECFRLGMRAHAAYIDELRRLGPVG
jgi:acetylornithine deacetylase/succinyl-diaminopimelate desuccinylase-like protein